MKKHTQKKNSEMAEALRKVLLGFGAQPTKTSYEYQLDTQAGLLNLSVRPNLAQPGPARCHGLHEVR